MKWKLPGSGSSRDDRDSSDRTTHVSENTTPPRQKRVVYYNRSSEQAPPASSSERTQLYDPTGGANPDKANQNASNDPVVGWLVVVEGPGKGRSFEIGKGSNPIGRDAKQKVALNFGDEAIHREKHASVVYDPVSRRFFLQSGNDARNLTYLADKLVLTPVEISAGDVISIGQTKLAFVAFCGPDFSWS